MPGLAAVASVFVIADAVAAVRGTTRFRLGTGGVSSGAARPAHVCVSAPVHMCVIVYMSGQACASVEGRDS